MRETFRRLKRNAKRAANFRQAARDCVRALWYQRVRFLEHDTKKRVRHNRREGERNES